MFNAHLRVGDDIGEVMPGEGSPLQKDVASLLRTLAAQYQQLISSPVSYQRLDLG